MTRILLVEDHALVREAMCQSLSRLEEGLECGEAADAAQALEKLESSEWDMALVDLMLPDMSGFSLLGVLAKRYPDLPVIVVSALNDPASVRRALKAGASGFVHKSSSGDTMLEAVRVVLDGGRYAPEGIPTSGVRKVSFAERYGLTAAQNRVVELLAQGKTNREIADLLGLSEGTVKVHMSNIFKIIKVSNRSQAILLVKRYDPRA